MKTGFLCVLILPLLCCCSIDESCDTTSWRWIEIDGRDSGQIDDQRQPIYRVKAPCEWVHTFPSQNTSIYDTMTSIVEFYIYTNSDDEDIRITIHNFPSDTLDDRIPPSAQVARWQQQFDSLGESNMTSEAQSFGGFVGMRFDGEGTLQGKKQQVLGWAMQLVPMHHLTLQSPQPGLDNAKRRQMRGDYTIKAVGPVKQMNKHRENIIRFARSFELIDEIPTPY